MGRVEVYLLIRAKYFPGYAPLPADEISTIVGAHKDRLISLCQEALLQSREQGKTCFHVFVMIGVPQLQWLPRGPVSDKLVAEYFANCQKEVKTMSMAQLADEEKAWFHGCESDLPTTTNTVAGENLIMVSIDPLVALGKNANLFQLRIQPDTDRFVLRFSHDETQEMGLHCLGSCNDVKVDQVLGLILRAVKPFPFSGVVFSPEVEYGSGQTRVAFFRSLVNDLAIEHQVSDAIVHTFHVLQAASSDDLDGKWKGRKTARRD